MSDEASSLISINEATVQELQTLKHIGPKRAMRIVRYRQEVESIGSERILAIASGLSRKQLSSIRPSIDWRKPPTPFKDKVAPLFVYSLLILGIISRLPDFNLSDPASAVFNGLVILMITGLVTLLCSILIESEFSTPVLESKLRFIGYSVAIASLLGFVSLYVMSLFSGTPQPQLPLVLQFIVLSSLILIIIFGPGLHVRLLSTYNDTPAQNVNSQIRIYQIALVPIVFVCYLYLLLASSTNAITMIFYIWLSAICCWFGNELRNNRSFYLSFLSDLDERRLEFLLDGSKIDILLSRRYAIAYFAFGFLLIANIIANQLL